MVSPPQSESKTEEKGIDLTEEVSRAIISVAPVKNTLYELEEDYLSKEKAAHIQKIQDDNEGRKKYATWIFVLTCSWLGIVLTIIVLNGIALFHLSDAVLITLITTTTLNVLGFLRWIVKYFFNPSKST